MIDTKKKMSFFETYCKVLGISYTIASKIIDGRYKPYLSAIDDLYYTGNDLQEAKYNALNAALKCYNIDAIRDLLSPN